MLVLTPAQRGLAGNHNGFIADSDPVDSADGADKMVKDEPWLRQSSSTLLINSTPPSFPSPLWIGACRFEYFRLRLLAEAIANFGRNTGVR
jgi:hypothetical protein